MIVPPKPSNEEERLEKLSYYEILDTKPEKSFDELTELASQICGTKISLITLVDQDRQWFKSRHGLKEEETPRDISWCGYTILGNEVFEIPDSEKDERFKGNPLLTGEPHVRFYAGAPLITGDGYKLGTICVIDKEPKKLNNWQKSVLQKLSRQVVYLLEGRIREKKLKLAKSKLEEQQKISIQQARLASIGLLATGVGHEINNPLTIIKGYLSSIMKDLKNNTFDRDLIFKTVAKIDSAADRIVVIVNSLRKLSRADVTQLEIFCIQDALKDSFQLLKEIYLKEGIELELELETKTPINIQGLKGRFEQVVINLISNAKDATLGQEKRLIKINLSEGKKRVILKIIDNGKGIPKEIQDQIFDPFFTTKDINKGTGIGLSIVNSIIKELNGEIDFETGPTGTSFIIDLPIYDINHEVQPKHSHAPTESSQYSLKALVVDDEEDIRFLLQVLLSGMGIEVKLAQNGKEALEECTRENFDLVLSDLKMPEMSGDALIKNIYSIKGESRPKIIIMTGGIDESDLNNQASRDLIDGYLTKPFDENKICHLLNELFPQKKWTF